MQSFIFYFVIGIKITFLIPPPHTLLLMMRQIKQSVTNQAMNKLKQIEQCVSYKTNEASYVQQIGQILQYVTN